MHLTRFEPLLSGKVEALRPRFWGQPLSSTISSLRHVIQARIPSHLSELDPELAEATLELFFNVGLFSLTVPKDCGGSQGTVRDFTACMEDIGGLGPAWAITAAPHLCISVSVVDRLGLEPLRSQVLRSIKKNHKLLAFAITEDAGSDLGAMRTCLSRDASGRFFLRGRKQWVTNLKRASHISVAALCPQLHSVPGAAIMVLVPIDAPGVTLTKPWGKLGANGSDTSDLFFDDVVIQPEWFLGKPGEAFQHFNELVLPGRLGAGAAAVGMAVQALRWAGQKHLLDSEKEAEWVSFLEGSRRSLCWAACLVDEGDPCQLSAVAFAKLLACNLAQEVVDGVDWVCARKGMPSPPVVARARDTMGLFCLLKGPGELLSIQAITHLSRMLQSATIPMSGCPKPLRTALETLLITLAGLEIAENGRSQPVLMALGEALSYIQMIAVLCLDYADNNPMFPPFISRVNMALNRARNLSLSGSDIFIESAYALLKEPLWTA